MIVRTRRQALTALSVLLLLVLCPPGAATAQTGSTPGLATPPDTSVVPQLTPGTTTAPEGGPPTTATTAEPAVPAPRPTAAAPTQALPSTLPATGMDGRVIGGIGAGLLLCGIGLRLRTTRERF